MARRAHIRMACVATIYEECSGNVGYNQKNQFLEDRIEVTHKYFDVPDDLNKGEGAAAMDKVKKDLFKVSREIKRIIEEGENIKVNPREVLDQICEEEKETERKRSEALIPRKKTKSNKSIQNKLSYQQSGGKDGEVDDCGSMSSSLQSSSSE